MKALCIDPGTFESGIVVFDSQKVIESNASVNNLKLVESINNYDVEHVVIEEIVSYGMPVGQETFDTCVWIGRFIQAFKGNHTLISRREVKLWLCNSAKAKDKNVRVSVLNRFAAIGGGKTPQIGTKEKPGPLYGVSSHALSALAVGITYFEKLKIMEIK